MTPGRGGGAGSGSDIARGPRVANDVDPLDSLRKILRMEANQGFPDKTVTGGLDSFLSRRGADLAPTLGAPTSYSSLTPPQREEWASGVMARLDAKPNQAQTPAPRRKSLRPASIGLGGQRIPAEVGH